MNIMSEITNLEWILPDKLNIARRIVKRATKFTSEDQIVAWHELRKIAPHKGVNEFFDDFETLKREPARLRNVIAQFATEYNLILAEFKRTHPISCEFIWDIYQEAGVVVRGTSAIQDKLRRLTDRAFGFWYADMYAGHKRCAIQNEVFKPFDKNTATLIEHDKAFMHGIGRYHFQDAKGQKAERLWDIREKEIPSFNYTCEQD